MDVTTIPFNQLIDLKYADNPEFLLMLDNRTEYHNHLGTVHASALFALAEATSGYFLQNEFKDAKNIIPVVRTSNQKFRKPANGKVFSRARFIYVQEDDVLRSIADRKRIGISVEVSLLDETGTMVMQAVFDWVILPGNE